MEFIAIDQIISHSEIINVKCEFYFEKNRCNINLNYLKYAEVYQLLDLFSVHFLSCYRLFFLEFLDNKCIFSNFVKNDKRAR